MRALTGSEIIHLWESAYRFHPIDRPLAILQTVMAEHARDELAALVLSRRDALLLALRRATFGDLLVCKNQCPHCDEMMELELSCSALATDRKEPQQIAINWEGFKVKVRPLNSFDLAAAAGQASLQQAQTLLMERCVTEASRQGRTLAPETLPQKLTGRISEAALAADPHAEILLGLHCSGCRQQSNSVLDIGHILWLEISSRAQRLLLEVHLLARAYGWAEAEILQLSTARRSAYLQMVAA